MKAIYTFLFFLGLSLVSVAQSSKGFSFQGYARGADGSAIQNEANLEVKFSLFTDDENNPEFTEEQIRSTNGFGIFQAVVGETNTAAFDALDFASNDFFLKVEVKDNGAYQTVSKKLLRTVPYAKASESATVSAITERIMPGSNGVPPGSIAPFAGTSAPEGWELCNGNAFDGTLDKYKPLYDVIQNTYGGTAASSFNVPDLRGVFLRGLDNGRGLDDDRDLGPVVQSDQIKSHNHSASTSGAGGHSHSVSYWASDSEGGSGYNSMLWDDQYLKYQTFNTNAAGEHSHPIYVGATGGVETRPKNLAVNYIIKL